MALPASNHYHETSSDQSDYGEEEESESSSGADGEGYGEEDESQESSFTDYQPSDKVFQHYGQYQG